MPNSLLDARGVNAAVGDEGLERDPPDFAAHRVETREDDCFRSVVDDEIDPRHLLERPDVATFSADDPALHVVAGDVDDRDGRLGGVVGGDALDRDPNDVAGTLVGLFASASLRVADDGRGLLLDVVLDAVDEFGARLVGGHAGDALETVALFRDRILEFLLGLGDLTLHRRELVLALVQRLCSTVDGGFALGHAGFERLNLLAAFLVVVLRVLLELEYLVLGLEQGFLLERLGLLLRVLDRTLRVFHGTRGTALEQETVDGEAEGDADDQRDDDQNDG